MQCWQAGVLFLLLLNVVFSSRNFSLFIQNNTVLFFFVFWSLSTLQNVIRYKIVWLKIKAIEYSILNFCASFVFSCHSKRYVKISFSKVFPYSIVQKTDFIPHCCKEIAWRLTKYLQDSLQILNYIYLGADVNMWGLGEVCMILKWVLLSRT